MQGWQDVHMGRQISIPTLLAEGDTFHKDLAAYMTISIPTLLAEGDLVAAVPIIIADLISIPTLLAEGDSKTIQTMHIRYMHIAQCYGHYA